MSAKRRTSSLLPTGRLTTTTAALPAIQADKALKNLEIAETRYQAKMFSEHVIALLEPDKREQFEWFC